MEQGLSVPDSEMLITLSEVLETPVSTLLGENIIENKADDLKIISEKLEVINLQLAQRKELNRKTIHWLMIFLFAIIVIIFLVLIFLDSFYFNWDYSNLEYAILGTAIHSFEWLFVRIAPFTLIGIIIGIILTKKKA